MLSTRHVSRSRILLQNLCKSQNRWTLRNGVRCFASEVSTTVDGGALQKDSKPLTNNPFAKNLFLGKFDKKMLVFPEALSKEEVEDLNAMVQPVEKFFTEDLDSKSIDANAVIPDEVLDQIKEFGLYGQQIPIEYGGLELNATQYTRMAEVTGLDAAIGVTLAAHQTIGLKGILIAGTEEQKAKYLPRLATGEHTAAFALTEPSSGSDAASIQTKATLSEDGKTFLLNGEKIWITNGGTADIFTVFAKAEVTDEITGKQEEKVTAFIVERSFGGITNGKPEDKLGIRGSNTCQVFFDNTPVPIENVIGDVGGGFKIAMSILNSGRFSMGSTVAGAIKHVLRISADYAIHRTQFKTKLKDFQIIKDKFTFMAAQIYAMESMAYLTAATIDAHQHADCSVEAAIVKVFSSEAGWECASECLQVLGGLGFTKDYPHERYLRDARICQIFEGTNEILRLFIALGGIQHAGKELAQDLTRMKDPLNNLGFMISKAMDRHRRSKKRPVLPYKLIHKVHPDVAPIAEELEIRLLRFQFTIENQLSIYRERIVEEQLILKRISDVAIDLYAMTCVLARASRSLSIGQKNAEHEKLLAHWFCRKALERITKDLHDLNAGPVNNGDFDSDKIADEIFKNGGYACEHPLSRNW